MDVKMAKLTISIEEELIKPLKIKALENDTNVSKIITEMVKEYLAKH